MRGAESQMLTDAVEVLTHTAAIVESPGPLTQRRAIASRATHFLWKMQLPLLIRHSAEAAAAEVQTGCTRSRGLTIVQAGSRFHFICKCRSVEVPSKGYCNDNQGISFFFDFIVMRNCPAVTKD